jgi:hypothetical protein
VLTEETALKYFDKEDPLGKTLIIGSDNRSYKVTGIAKSAPANSHLKFNALMSFTSVDKDIYHGWSGNSLQTYIRKTPTTSIESVNTKLDELVEKYVGPELEQGLGLSFADFKKNGGAYAYYIFPMTDTHLKSSQIQDDYQKSDIKYVYIFAFVGHSLYKFYESFNRSFCWACKGSGLAQNNGLCQSTANVSISIGINAVWIGGRFTFSGLVLPIASLFQSTLRKTAHVSIAQ